MTAIAALAPEWKRIACLCRIQQKARLGQQTSPEDIAELSDLQDDVLQARAAGAWQSLGMAGLDQLAHDILAVVAAPHVSHVAAFAYGAQAGEGPGRTVSLPFLQALLSLQPEDQAELRAALSSHGALVQSGLVATERRNDLVQLRAGRRLLTSLFGVDNQEPPPGSVYLSRPAAWDELIVAPDVTDALKHFMSLIRHRSTVETKWGGKRRGGPVALFSGPSGTGKTLAAQVLATTIGWPLYRVDLGQLVSKYIGDTEKNLNALFDSVHGTESILLFDESDALFGKRGEVRDARDRFANMEVSHLLSRIENHHSPCILTTNLRESIDPAFLRRFHIIADFAFPDAAVRLALWHRHLPPRAPRMPGLDFELIARTVRLTGAAIENAALCAAYLAAADGSAISMAHLTRGIWNELTKDTNRRARTDLGALAPYLESSDHENRPVDTQAAA